jgi:hypothetical protein
MCRASLAQGSGDGGKEASGDAPEGIAGTKASAGHGSAEFKGGGKDPIFKGPYQPQPGNPNLQEPYVPTAPFEHQVDIPPMTDEDFFIPLAVGDVNVTVEATSIYKVSGQVTVLEEGALRPVTARFNVSRFHQVFNEVSGARNVGIRLKTWIGPVRLTISGEAIARDPGYRLTSTP